MEWTFEELNKLAGIEPLPEDASSNEKSLTGKKAAAERIKAP